MTRVLAVAVAGLLLAVGMARADDLEDNIVYIPMPQGEALHVRNPLGSVTVRGWDRPQVRIVANKRALVPQLLDRLKARVEVLDGKVDLATGVYLSDGTWHPIPQRDAAIDLTIHAPAGMTVDAVGRGDVTASGFNAGAKLSSETGEIHAYDLAGPVATHAAAGRQSLQSIRGRVDANGIEGDLELQSIDGDTVDALVYKGQITAREVHSPVVRLSAITGTIIFMGPIVVGGRYEIKTVNGDIRMTLTPIERMPLGKTYPHPFRIVADAPNGTVASALQIEGGPWPKGHLAGSYRGGGASLDLHSKSGSISLSSAQQ